MVLSAYPAGPAHGPGPEVSTPQGVIAYALPEDLSVLDRHWHPSERQDFRDFLDKGVVGYGASGPTPGEEAKTVTVVSQSPQNRETTTFPILTPLSTYSSVNSYNFRKERRCFCVKH